MPEENKTQIKKTDPKAKQLSFEEYKALQDKEAKKFKGVKLPFVVKLILASPFILIFLFGIFYVPFLAIKGCAQNTTQSSTSAAKK